MSEDVAVKAVKERILALRTFLAESIYLLENRIGHCSCEDSCVECKADEKYIQAVEKTLIIE